MAACWRVVHEPRELDEAKRGAAVAKAKARLAGDASALAKISSWPGYEATPVVSLESVAAKLGVSAVWAKVEGGRFGVGSFKPLGSALVVSEVEGTTSCGTVACASDGNHGLGMAWGAQKAGLEAVVFLPRSVSPGMVGRIEGFGARVERIDGGYEACIKACREAAKKRGWFVVQDVGAVPEYVDVPTRIHNGYSVVAAEILNQGYTPTHVLLNAGVGGFAAGVFGHLAAKGCDAFFATVEPTEADCLLRRAKADGSHTTKGPTLQVGLDCHEVCPVAWDLLDGLVDACFAVDDACVQPLLRLLHNDFAIDAGESAVAGLAVLLAAAGDPKLKLALRLTPESRVLVALCEGPPDPDAFNAIIQQDLS